VTVLVNWFHFKDQDSEFDILESRVKLYFVQFLKDVPKVTSEYWRIRRTLPASASFRTIVEGILWPIDGLSRDILTSQLEGFHQKKKESVRDFSARFLDCIDTYRVFDPEITDKQVRHLFKTLLCLSELILVNPMQTERTPWTT